MTERINLNNTLQDVMIKMSAGNPGALTVFTEAKYG